MAHVSVIQFDIDAAKRAWGFVGKTFQDMHEKCDECDHCDHSGEMHPYGEGQAFEAICECRLGQRASDQPEMCPVYAAHLAELRELDTTESGST